MYAHSTSRMMTKAERLAWERKLACGTAFREALAVAADKAGIALDLTSDKNGIVIPCNSPDEGRATIARVKAFWKAWATKNGSCIGGVTGAYYAPAAIDGCSKYDDLAIGGWRIGFSY